jgi:hypothetical protein
VDRGLRLEGAGRSQELLDNSVALLLLTGGMNILNDLDPDGCMVQ